MNTRRDFIRRSMIGAVSIPTLSSTLHQEYLLSDIDLSLPPNESFWQTVRKQFPLKEGQVYFNNGTMGPISGYALNAMIYHMQHYAVHAAEVDYKEGSGPELLTGYFPYEEIRKKIGKIVNANWKEISLTQNATFGMNYVGMGLDLKAGDEVLNTNQEHGGGFGAWQTLAKRKGCVYKQAIMPEPSNDQQEILDSIFKEVNKKTKVIAIPHMVSIYGTILPVKEICQEARNRGIFTVLDGAQCVGHIPVNVKEIGCDAYYSSLHKWLLAPAGSGMLYINESMVDKIWTTIASYNWDNREDHGFRLMQNGTGNPAQLAGYDAAIDFYNTIGQERWTNRIKELGDQLRTGLQSIPGITIHSPTNPLMCAGITTYSMENMTGPALQKYLWETQKLQPRSVGNELVRHSVHIYNNKQEVDRTIEALRKL